MSKQKEKFSQEQQLRLMKFDCEMRLECLKLATSVTKDPEQLESITKGLANYVFKGLFDSDIPSPNKEAPKE